MLRVQVTDCDGLHTCVLSGRLTRASGPALAVTIAQLCAGGASSVELDIGNLRTLEPEGMEMISFTRELCERRGCRFSLLPLSRSLNAPSRPLARGRRGSTVIGRRGQVRLLGDTG